MSLDPLSYFTTTRDGFHRERIEHAQEALDRQSWGSRPRANPILAKCPTCGAGLHAPCIGLVDAVKEAQHALESLAQDLESDWDGPDTKPRCDSRRGPSADGT